MTGVLTKYASKAVAGLAREIADKESRLSVIKSESALLARELAKARHAIAYYRQVADHAETPGVVEKRAHLRFDERAFQNARDRYIANPSEPLMEEITENYFKPLAAGYWQKECYRFRRLDESMAVRGAIVMCFLKFDNYDPALGSAFNYFTKVIQKHLQHESIKECTYYSRYQSIEAPDGDSE